MGAKRGARRVGARAATQDYAETIDVVAKLFNEWGWKVTIYDGAE